LIPNPTFKQQKARINADECKAFQRETKRLKVSIQEQSELCCSPDKRPVGWGTHPL